MNAQLLELAPLATALDGLAQLGVTELACHTVDPDLFFAESPADVERAKALCVGCPLQAECLTGALDRREPWGVWGGQLVVDGIVVARKRPRGRPRKHPLPDQQPAVLPAAARTRAA